jgi:hypothetical protein
VTKFSDEQLSAFVDGAAESELSTEIRKVMLTDLELWSRLETMRRNDATLRAAFEAALGSEGIALQPSPSGRRVVPFAQRRSAIAYWQMAAALMLTMAMGLIAGTLLYPAAQSLTQVALLELQPDGLVARSDLARGLSAAHSGVAMQMTTGSLNVKLSFRSTDGSLCRQFELLSQEASAQGVACRRGAEWHIAGWYSDRAHETGGYRTAAGSEDARMNSILDRLGITQALDRADEDAAIRSHWMGEAH